MVLYLQSDIVVGSDDSSKMDEINYDLIVMTGSQEVNAQTD